MCDDCETLIQAPVPAQIIDKGIFNRHRRHRAQQLPRFENIHLQIAAPTLHRIARTVADRVPRVAADLYPSTGEDDLWFPGLHPGGRHAGRGTAWGWLTGR